jgi:hypothetical protein
VQLFSREQRKAGSVWAQIKPCLRAEDRQCAGPGAIGARLAIFENKPEKIVILTHEKP